MTASLLRGVDLAAFAVALVHRLRTGGVTVSAVGSGRLVEAMHVLVPVVRSQLYWAARLSLVSRAEDLPAFDAVFDPLAMDALRLGKISVGPPYFEAVLAPVFMALLALVMPAAWLRWGQGVEGSLRGWAMGLVALFIAAAGAGAAVLHAVFDEIRPLVVLTLALAIGVGGATKLWAWRQWRKRGLTASQWGMVIAHLGVAVFAMGVAVVSGYGVERDVRLVPGNSKASAPDAASQTHPIANCQLTFDRIDPARGPNYMALAGNFTLACAGDAPVPLKAEKRNYVGSSMPMTESAIRWGLTRDLYVALGEPLEGTPFGAWSVRVQYKPFMRWVWIGVVLMALGAGVAAAARRYRSKRPLPHAGPAPPAIRTIETMGTAATAAEVAS